MKIVLVAPGYKSFPPNGWGAVESIVWDYYENLLKRNYEVYIVNNTNPNIMVNETNSYAPDVVHIMYDDHIIIAPYLTCKKIYYTSHYAYITSRDFLETQRWYLEHIFTRVLDNKKTVYINAISDEIKQVYVNCGFPKDRINVICNGAREDLFRFSLSPKKPQRSVYVAKVEFRKAQYKYQTIPGIDFVGNYHNSPFDINAPNYLGEWDKPTLYENLTDYGNLVLLSDGEADPLVVKEALMAGLGVVISECAYANLDLSKEFITVIPDKKRDDLEYVSNEIMENLKYSIANRQEIRDYAIANFSWERVLDKYCQICL